MIEIITKDEFDKNMFELSLHGVPKDEIDKLRSKFDNQENKKQPYNPLIEKKKLQGLGFYFGKKNKTKVINR